MIDPLIEISLFLVIAFTLVIFVIVAIQDIRKHHGSFFHDAILIVIAIIWLLVLSSLPFLTTSH